MSIPYLSSIFEHKMKNACKKTLQALKNLLFPVVGDAIPNHFTGFRQRNQSIDTVWQILTHDGENEIPLLKLNEGGVIFNTRHISCLGGNLVFQRFIQIKSCLLLFVLTFQKLNDISGMFLGKILSLFQDLPA